jgi:hypothetical protein
VTGRCTDSALALGPALAHFGWPAGDWDRRAAGVIAGHVIECGGQASGGNFDGGWRSVPDLARLGYPIAEIDEDGTVVVTKHPGLGGLVDAAVVKEQLLYEIGDPARYLAPDVVADFSGVEIRELGPDRVSVRGATGHERPETLKLSIGYRDGYIGEGQISYAGPGAVARAKLALRIVEERLRLTGVRCRETRFELIGVDALHGATLSSGVPEPYEVRARVVGRTDSADEALRIGNEVETLYTNGPAAGGGATRQVREVIGVVSAFLPRERVTTTVQCVEVTP